MLEYENDPLWDVPHHSKELKMCHCGIDMQQVIDTAVAKEVTKEHQKLNMTINEYKAK